MDIVDSGHSEYMYDVVAGGRSLESQNVTRTFRLVVKYFGFLLVMIMQLKQERHHLPPCPAC